VIKQDGAYKVVTSGGRFSETGNEVLYLLKSGREKEARALLDWLRGMTHKGGGDDPLSGPSFPHFWTAGDKGDAAAMRLAAGSLLSWNDGISEQLPTLRSEWETATGERKLNLAIVLANGYMYLQDGVHLKEMAAGIMKDYPDSNVALTLAGNADTLLKDWDDLKKMFDGQIAKHPEDESVLRLESSFLEEKCDWAGSRAALQKIFDLGKATAEDYNSYAWTGLFDGKVDDDTLKQARQADMMTNNWNFSILHTLASLYAYQGKTTEARDALLKAMAADSETKPSPDVWFVFGSIYEKYGLNDAATEAYAKVEKPLGRISPQSTYALAQTRLKVLAAAAN